MEIETQVTLTADITAAFVSNNTVAMGELPSLIASIGGALAGLGIAEPEEVKPVPACDPRRSVKPDHIVSLLDGKRYKMLKRHISLHGYTPETYRQTFGLPANYPMVASDYSDRRRDLAKSIGLGTNPNQQRGRRKSAVA